MRLKGVGKIAADLRSIPHSPQAKGPGLTALVETNWGLMFGNWTAGLGDPHEDPIHRFRALSQLRRV